MIKILIVIFFLSTSIFPQKWIDKRYENGTNLFSVVFLDSLNGIIVGDSGLVLLTNDAGESWTKNNSINFSGTLLNLHLVDSLHLYSLGRSYSGHSYFLVSSDKGNTWSSHQFTFLNVYLTDMHFLNKDTGWVCGLYGKIYRTTDMMNSWEELTDGENTFPLRRIFFTDIDNGWVLGGRIDMIGFIRRTYDQGNSWRNKVITIEPLYDIYRLNEDTIYVVGGDPEFGGWIYQSSDKGETWELQDVPIGTITLYRISFDNPTLGWATGAGSILNTTDKGITWETSFTTDESVFSISSSNGKDYWFAGTNGFLMFYKDTSKVDSLPNSINNQRNDDSDIKSLSDISVFPNPFNSSTKINFKLSKNSFVSVELYDILGSKVNSIMYDNLFGGNYSIPINLTNYSSGVYFIVLKTPNEISTNKIFLIK
ncbi:MAG: T9SS type A sorting domain-containing protein [Ignavibacteriaceae bacterium]|nr:T9SS type A sorting domain-containing protein [Ignavibacteriaceae bacterium]